MLNELLSAQQALESFGIELPVQHLDIYGAAKQGAFEIRFDASPKVYHHNRTGEDNGDAHHKRQLMGREVVVAITEGSLDFGPWEQIFYGEFDGNRSKRILIKIIGE